MVEISRKKIEVDATKIEEYVPTKTPTIRAIENPSSEDPPNTNNDNNTSNVVELVMMVLLIVCVIAELRIVRVSAVLIDLKFSLIRS